MSIDIINKITIDIDDIEIELPLYIYKIILEEDYYNTYKFKLVILNDKFEQYILKLDNIVDIDRIVRKNLIIRIQKIQKILDQFITSKSINILSDEINTQNEIIKQLNQNIKNIQEEKKDILNKYNVLKKKIELLLNKY